MKIAPWLLLLMAAGSAAQAPTAPLRFRITLDPGAASGPVSGRMLVFMSSDPEPRDVLSASASVAALEFENIAPGETVQFDPDVKAYPQPFSKARPGSYQFMALLDRDHSYARNGRDGDDLLGPVVRLDLDPADTKPVALALTRRHEADAVRRDTEEVKVVGMESRLLGHFWGRPISMRAGVVLPPSYGAEPGRRYPAIYVHHGFGGDYSDAFRAGMRIRRDMERGERMEAVLVFMDGSFPSGDHEFADSVNNGPWGRALVEEFIPFLESRFRLIPKPAARFLTGHSSGGWASLWLQVTYPDVFGGAWPTSPDPVDFRSFSGVNLEAAPPENMYRDAGGRARNLVRRNGKDLVSFEQYAKQEEVLGEYGGQLVSFESVFSPRGEDGRPLRLFNRVTGQIDPAVARAWEKYDIRLKLDREWSTLAPKLKGKLHIICGTEDTFHLEEAVEMLCRFLKEKGSDAVCELVPGRDHMNLYEPFKTYPEGLELRIAREIQAKFQAPRK